jgi:hypothetical protein
LGCTDCCQDGITVFEVEAARIRAEAREVLLQQPGPAGACAFLSADGACRIYDQRPYVCRTQGLPLRWLDEGPGGETVEYRDICPLNEDEGAPDLASLAAEACWSIGPFEVRLAQLQAETGAAGRRVPLRGLFGPRAS